jgi:hypothetical protein
MDAGVNAEVDQLDGPAREGEGRTLDSVGVAEEREDRSVMIDVAVDVDEAGARRLDGLRETAQAIAVTALAHVGDALEPRRRRRPERAVTHEPGARPKSAANSSSAASRASGAA